MAEGDELSQLRQELERTKIQLAKAELAAAAPRALLDVSLGTEPNPSSLVGVGEGDPFTVTFHSIVIFGADGNLAMLKTFPALFSLMRQHHISEDVAVLGYARVAMTSEEFRKKVFGAIYTVKHPQSDRLKFLSRITYHHGQFNDPKAFELLRVSLEVREKEQEDAWMAKHGGSSGGGSEGSCCGGGGSGSGGGNGGGATCQAATSFGSNSKSRGVGDAAASSSSTPSSNSPQPLARTFRHVRIFYLAVPPFLYPEIAVCCRAAGLRRPATTLQEEQRDRFVLEKPFGRDVESCGALCDAVGAALSESQMFRIDHYLGKELVMNVLVMRFANISFHAIWDRQSIRSVHITCKESVGTSGRGGYFDSYGIIRDVMQNHLIQILALVGMEQPLSLTAEHIRQEKVKLLQAVAPLSLEDLLVGQYCAAAPGEVGPGSRPMPGYLDDPTITNKQSTTETFAAAVLHINNPRWAGVPFIMKAGKALEESKVEVRIRFHAVPGALETFGSCSPNELVIRVQPDERIYWKITSKVPGLDFSVETRRMDLLYANHTYGSSSRRHGGGGGGGSKGAGGGGSVTSAGSSSLPSAAGGGLSRPMFAAATAAAVAAATGTAPPPVVGGSGFGFGYSGTTGGGAGGCTSSGCFGSGSGGGGVVAHDEELPGAYERLILEVFKGDQTNFVHADELLASWRIFTPALHALKAAKVVPEPYPHGSRGPVEAEAEFAKRFGFLDGFPAAAAPHHQNIAWGMGRRDHKADQQEERSRGSDLGR